MEMAKRWAVVRLFFFEIVFLTIPTLIFLYGFFLTKREMGLSSHINPSFDPHPPLYVIDPSQFGSRLEQDSSSQLPLWRSKYAAKAPVKDVLESLREWEMSSTSSCLTPQSIDGNIKMTTSLLSVETLRGVGQKIGEFVSCRVNELNRISGIKTMKIWDSDGTGVAMLTPNSLEVSKPMLPLVDKVIMIVIDALRFDFVKETKHGSQTGHHLNQMKFLNNLLNTETNKSRLFEFVADAPTVTTQRLKALVSGMSFFEEFKFEQPDLLIAWSNFIQCV